MPGFSVYFATDLHGSEQCFRKFVEHGLGESQIIVNVARGREEDREHGKGRFGAGVRELQEQAAFANSPLSEDREGAGPLCHQPVA